MNEQRELESLSRAEAASLLAWWLEAGVDVAIREEPRDWRAKPPATPPPLVVPPPVPAEKPQSSGPTPPTRPARESLDTLDAFHAWLAETADLPLFRSGAARALPHGPAEAELMLLTGIPGIEDTADGRPIGGDAWALTERMLAAIGLTPDQVYVASQACFSGPGTIVGDNELESCRETLMAQIRLAAPKRLLLFGDQPSKLLLGQPMAGARGRLHRVAGIPTAVTFPPRHLLQNPQHKALAWVDLLLIMGE